MTSVPAVELQAVARRFGRRWALRGVDLSVQPGEAVAVTGRNGSGKTTLLRVCSTLLRPTRGGGRIYGFDLVRDPSTVRSHIGFLAHRPGLYDDLTADENLSFAARMQGLDRDARADRIGSVLRRVGLWSERDERVRGFSAGMRRRLALGRVLLNPPRLLLLDEPYASFDAEGIALVNEVVLGVTGGGGAALVATHDLERSREILSREIRLHDGRIVDPSAHDEAVLWPALGGT